jgi:hypothetical protein
LSGSFEKIEAYSQKEAQLKKIEKVISLTKKREEQRYYMDRWLHAFNAIEVMKAAVQQREFDIKQQVMGILQANKLKKYEEKYQMLRVIQFFGERRPELLLAFSKTFLVVSHEYGN